MKPAIVVDADARAARRPGMLSFGSAARTAARELWEARDLLILLAWRDVLVRYKQTLLGVGWAVVRPVATMLVLVFVFQGVAGLDSPAAPYPVFVLAGLVAFQLAASTLQGASHSLVANAPLVTRAYFPRIVLPLSVVLSNLLDFALALAVLLALMAVLGIVPTWRAGALPALVVLAVAQGLGAGLLLATWHARFRDIGYAVPYLVQLALYLGPIGYDTARIAEEWRWVYVLNPAVGLIDGFRWALLADYPWPGGSLGISTLMSFWLLAAGLAAFSQGQRRLADVI